MGENIIDFLIITLFILLGMIAYRFLLKYLSKGKVDQKAYCELYSLDEEPAHGELNFYFVCPSKLHVDFVIWEADKVALVLKSQSFEEGGHLIKFDSTTLPNGSYFFGIETVNQKTQKRFSISN